MNEEKRSFSLNEVSEGTLTEVENMYKAPSDVTKVIPNNYNNNTYTTAGMNDTNMSPINIHEILPKKQVQENSLEASLFDELDMAVAREKESITQRMNDLAKKQREEYEKELEKQEELAQAADDNFAVNDYDNHVSKNEINDDDEIYESPTLANTYLNLRSERIKVDDAPITIENVKKEDNVIKPITPDSSMNIEQLLNLSDEDFKEEENEVNNEDELLEKLKKEVKDRISPVKKVFDLSKFTIAKKAISAQKIMKMAIQPHQNIADWVLYSAKRPISLTGLSGSEILKLNPENSNRNRLNTFRDMYRIIYDHVYDANKPDFELWLKQTRFTDLNHIYFGLYMATFGGSSFINYSCPHCNKVFIKDVDFKDMVNFKDEKTREEVRTIQRMDSTSLSNDSYPVDMVQISNNYVFGLHIPSIWNVVIETASLSDQFLEKYGDLIDVASYIDSIYLIDAENNILIPIDTKPDPNDQAKSSARRIKAFYDVIHTLSSEDYYALRVKIQEYDEGVAKVSYKIPGCTCPECEKEIPDNTEVSPDYMLFTRHQLAAIGNM